MFAKFSTGCLRGWEPNICISPGRPPGGNAVAKARGGPVQQRLHGGRGNVYSVLCAFLLRKRYIFRSRADVHNCLAIRALCQLCKRKRKTGKATHIRPGVGRLWGKVLIFNTLYSWLGFLTKSTPSPRNYSPKT